MLGSKLYALDWSEIGTENIWLFNVDQLIVMLFNMDFAHFIVKIQNVRQSG